MGTVVLREALCKVEQRFQNNEKCQSTDQCTNPVRLMSVE